MKIRILSACIFTCFFFTGHAQVCENNWQATPLSIDGNPNDWTTKLRLYDSNSKLMYEFRNDDKNLYFVFKSEEKSLQRQMEQAGMKLKIVIKGAPKTKATIEFKKNTSKTMMPTPPGGMNNGTPPSFPQQQTQNGQLRQDNNQNQLPMKPEFMPKDTAYVKGFMFAQNFILSNNQHENTITFAKSRGNSDESAFELVIPIRELFGDNFQLANIKNIPIQFNLTINALSQSSSSSRMSGGMGGRMGGGPGGEMGGGPGGGMGGGPGGGMDGGPGGGMGGGPGGEMGNQSSMPNNMDEDNSSNSKKEIKALIQLTTAN